MEESIRDFPTQFGYGPKIEYKEKLGTYGHFVLAGMGGSHLPAEIINYARPDIDLTIHTSYGLPPRSESFPSDTLFIASSYSGNTEEVLDFAEKIFNAKKPLAIMGSGGKLIEFAQKNTIPYIQFPDMGIQPRMALGHSTLALSYLLNDQALITEISGLHEKLSSEVWQKSGQELASKLQGKVPVIYSDNAARNIAAIWKIKFNETGKIPSFTNVFPELNHNEMSGFDVVQSTRALSEHFAFVFLSDASDHPQIRRRMDVTKKLYEDKGFGVFQIELRGETLLQKMFNALLLADWTALELSRFYHTEPEKVVMIENLKRMLT